jgi:Protein of unknown function (DUF2721)
MNLESFQNITVILQTAVSPVILISGVGLLLLTMTNRLGRLIDRQRILCAQLRTCSPREKALYSRELSILWGRARLIRGSIILASFSVLFASLMIILLFLIPLSGWQAGFLVIPLFILCLTCLIGSLFVFILDVNRSLTALQLEISDTEQVDGILPDRDSSR